MREPEPQPESQSNSQAAEKICRLCHRDCSTVPRIKDHKRGIYYCRACAVEAFHRTQGQKTPDDGAALGDALSAAAPQRDLKNATPAQLAELMHDSAVLDDLVKTPQLDSQAARDFDDALAAQATTPKRLTDPAIMRHKFGLIRRFFHREGVDNTILNDTWPMFIGSMSMALGGLTFAWLTTHLVMSIVAAVNDDEMAPTALRLGSAILLPAFSVWLFLSGNGIWKCRASSAIMIVRWAWTSIAVSTVYLVTILGLAASGYEHHRAFMIGFDLSGLSESSYTTTVWLIYVGLLFWPTFLIVWFTRSMTKVSVRRWSGRGAAS